MSKTVSTPTRTRRRSPWEAVFLAALSERPNISRACRLAHIDRSTPFAHRGRHPDFAAEMESAIETSIDALEDEAWRRAVDGNEEFSGVDRDGEPITYRKYSDQLMIELLRGNRPKKYARQVRIEIDALVRKVAEAEGLDAAELLKTAEAIALGKVAP